MKTTYFLFSILILLFSCEKEGEFSKNESNITVSPEATVLYNGDFQPTSGINVSGQVKILSENDQYKLELIDFSISDGPDLKVYLSKSGTPNDFVTLGNLTNSSVYYIPSQIDLADYKYVLIHCQQYNHLFATAMLIQN